jgi:hypothetical protein
VHHQHPNARRSQWFNGAQPRHDATCRACPHVLLLSEGFLGARETGEVLTVCSQCDKPETQCTCEKYCCFCQSQYNVRLCVDGLYYCPDCREACDVRLADRDEH